MAFTQSGYLGRLHKIRKELHGGVSLFIPCSVDLLLVELGQATVTPQACGPESILSSEQTCCGHPAITSRY